MRRPEDERRDRILDARAVEPVESPEGDVRELADLERAELVVVWATLDRSLGKTAIKSFVVRRDNPGLQLVRLEHKLGIRASDTAAFVLDDCRVPAEDLLGDPEIKIEGGSGLSEDEVQRMVTDAEAHAEEAHRLRELADARNLAE